MTRQELRDQIIEHGVKCSQCREAAFGFNKPCAVTLKNWEELKSQTGERMPSLDVGSAGANEASQAIKQAVKNARIKACLDIPNL